MRELEELVSRIEAYEPTIQMCDGPASILIMPRGGRVLGVDLGNGNLLWVNPRIEDVLLNREWNTGGIRTWISPERAFFYDDPEKFEGWRCPPGIDPAKYEITKKQKHAVELKSAISAQDTISKETLFGYINKRIEVQEAQGNKDSGHMRLTIHDALSVEDFKSPFALWSLVQVDPGESGEGTVTVPVVKNAQPIHYFNRIPMTYLRIFDDRVEFTLDGRKELKLGIRPEDLHNSQEAQLQYSFKKRGDEVLISILSRTSAKSQSECVDPARSNPTGPRAVIQSYNSELTSSGMRYGELEIQGPQAKMMSIDSRKTEEEVLINFCRNPSNGRMHA